MRGGTRRPRRTSGVQRLVEKSAVAVLLVIAWAWIMVTFGMVFYHGYYKKPTTRRKVAAFQQIFVPGDASHRQQPQRLGGSTSYVGASGATAPLALTPHESPLLLFTCNRDNYLKETLRDIQNYIPTDCSMGCPIVISQDGSHPKVTSVIQEFKASFAKINIPVVHLQHQSSLRRGSNAYEALAVHYGWALQQVFSGKAVDPSSVQPQRVVILEEDLHIAPDFFDYFTALAPILDQDLSLLAISAFNDNGFEHKVKDPQRLLRSDFFPGLGWMMSRKLWDDELQSKWPKGYWDDWLREPDQRQGRHIVRPEISRTFHFGVKGGASGNQFGQRLSQVLLNPTVVEWDHQELSYLQVDKYNTDYLDMIQSAQPASSYEQAMHLVQSSDVRLEYTNFAQFQRLAEELGLMQDEKANILRTAYHGVVETRPHGNKILFLIPSMSDVQKALSATRVA